MVLNNLDWCRKRVLFHLNHIPYDTVYMPSVVRNQYLGFIRWFSSLHGYCVRTCKNKTECSLSRNYPAWDTQLQILSKQKKIQIDQVQHQIWWKQNLNWFIEVKKMCQWGRCLPNSILTPTPYPVCTFEIWNHRIWVSVHVLSVACHMLLCMHLLSVCIYLFKCF